MPKFTKLDPNDVQIGRGRIAYEARDPYREALKKGDAGRIELVVAKCRRRLSATCPTQLNPDPPNPRPDSAAGTRKQVPL